MAELKDKCAHANCHCPAPAGSDYCSDYCSLNADDLEIGCSCGHSNCQSQLSAEQIKQHTAAE